MAKPFDLRKQFKLHDKALLRRLFADQPAMQVVPWETLRRHDVEPIVAAWESMHDDRRHFQVILLDVNELADPRGQRVLMEEMQWRCPDKLAQFPELSCPADKALWAYMEARDAFDQAAIFARAEALRNGQFSNRWNSLPREPLLVTAERIKALEEELRTYYWKKELRGERCRVHHYQRPGGAEYFFAYLPDWPDKLLTFDAEGNLTPREESYTFTNVFVCMPSEGAVEIIARGGKKVQLPLRKAFCRAVIGVEVDDEEPVRPSYRLDHLLDPAFAFTAQPDDRLAAVFLRRVRLVPKVYVPAVEYLEPKFVEGASRADVLAALGSLLSAYNLDRSQATVTQVGIQLQFMSDGCRKARTMTFNVSCPNTCDLKSKPDDVRVIGERLIRDWEILRD